MTSPGGSQEHMVTVEDEPKTEPLDGHAPFMLTPDGGALGSLSSSKSRILIAELEHDVRRIQAAASSVIGKLQGLQSIQRGDDAGSLLRVDEGLRPHTSSRSINSVGLQSEERTRVRLNTASSTPQDDGSIPQMSLVLATMSEGHTRLVEMPPALAERHRGRDQRHLAHGSAVTYIGTISDPIASHRKSSSYQGRAGSSSHKLKKLKMLALWEEAFAMADADMEEIRMKSSAGRTGIVKANLSLRTGQILQPPASTWRKRLVNPHSRARLIWDCIALCLIGYDLASIPVEVAWSLPLSSEGTPVAVVVVEIIFWTLDMALCFTAGFYDQGLLVWTMKEIRWHYLTNWFLFDVVMLLLDVVVVISREFKLTNWIRVTTWARLCRMLRMAKMTKIAFKLEEVAGSTNHRGTALLHAVLYTFALIFLLTHFIACAWYYIGQRNLDTHHGSWLEQDDIRTEELIPQYLYCFHWVLAQFTPAPVTIHPVSSGERTFTIFVILFSLFVIGKGIQRISQTVQDLNAARYDDNKLRRKVRQFLAVNRVPVELAIRTTRFVDNMLSKRSAVQLDGNLVSEHLMKELTMHLREPFLVKHPLFSSVFVAYPEVSSNICEALQLHAYDKGRALFTAGSMARCLFISSQGSFDLDAEEFVTTENFKGVHYFAELSLYANFLHTSTLTAVQFAEALTFTATDFKRCVMLFPVCLAMIVEYATQVLQRVRRDESMIRDNLCDTVTKQAFEATQFYKLSMYTEVEASTGKTEEMQSVPTDRQHQAASSEVTQVIRNFLTRCADGTIEDEDVVSECARVFPELDPQDGVYVKMFGKDERIRTIASMVNAIWLWRGNYEAFSGPQRSDVRMSTALWRKLQIFVKWTGVNEEMMHATLVMMVVRGMGNLQPLVQTFPRGHHSTARAARHIIQRENRNAPSAKSLTDHWKGMIMAAFDIHDGFNLGQFMEGENLPSNIQQLQEMVRQRGEGLLKLYLFAIVGVMSGRDLRGDSDLQQGRFVPGSRFMDDRRGRVMVSCLEALEHLFDSSPVAIYWSYMTWRAADLHMQTSTAQELALSRLMCLSRAHTSREVVQLYTIWASLEDLDRELISQVLLADGISERSVRFLMLPMCLANAKANAAVGVGSLLVVLADLLDMMKTWGCWELTEAMTLTLDLSDFAAFTSAVGNTAVFSTCLLRADLKQIDSRVNLVMTSRNWLRASDTDNSEVALVASIQQVLRRQRTIEEALRTSIAMGAASASKERGRTEGGLGQHPAPVGDTPGEDEEFLLFNF